MSEEVPTDAEIESAVQSMPWWLILIWGLLAVLVGIMLVTTPIASAFTLILFLGAYWFVGGLFTLASLVWDRSNMGWKIFIGAINVLAGIVIMTYPIYSSILVMEMLIIIIGIWALIIGGTKVYEATRSKDAGEGILGILSILFGIILLVYPFAAAYSLPIIAGFFALIGGLSAIVLSFKVKTAQAQS